jgi:hypothetical protein
LSLEILLPLFLIPLLILGGLLWYRRAMSRLEPDTRPRQISGSRLTSEHLQRLATPPWRVVYEIGSDRLGEVATNWSSALLASLRSLP